MGKGKKIGSVNKIRWRQKKQKVPSNCFQFFCPSDSFCSYIVVIVYPKGGTFDKKLRVLFVFFYAEKLDFGSIWATGNHLLQQGKFWLCARISHFFAWFHYMKFTFRSINETKDSSFYTKWGYSEKYACETQMITIPDTLS